MPGFGNTQDVALRTWLHEQGLEANDAGGEVDVLAIDNPELLGLFQAGHLDGAWEPEPYPSLLVSAGVAEPFVDEADLWPDGQFTTTVLLVNTTFLDAHPDTVKGLVKANTEAIQLIEDDPATAKADAQAGLVKAGARRSIKRSSTRRGASSRSPSTRSPRAWPRVRRTRTPSASWRSSRPTCGGSFSSIS